jgi:hypothetical protein
MTGGKWQMVEYSQWKMTMRSLEETEDSSIFDD